MSKDFFERLEEKVDISNSPIPGDPYPILTERERNIARRIRSATIEALKEMAVGEPMLYRFYQQIGSMFFASDRGDFTIYHSYHVMPPIPDGEEVAVLAVRLS